MSTLSHRIPPSSDDSLENGPVSRFVPGSIRNEAPVVASFCQHFLKPEMQEIYREITALRGFRPYVFTQHRENEAALPFPDVELFSRPWTRGLRQFWARAVFDLPILAYRGEVRQVLRRATKLKAQVLHAYTGEAGLYLLPLLRRREIPVVVSFHGAEPLLLEGGKGVQKRLRDLTRLADLILVRTESLKNALAGMGCKLENFRVHRTGVSLSASQAFIRTPPVEGDFRFIQASRLLESKGLNTTLHAFAIFAKEFPRSELILVGEGPLRKRLLRLAAELGLAEQVHLPGFLPQKTLLELYERSHVFLHPSQPGTAGGQEGLPNAMLEAMATGLPVVATHHGSIAEAVVDGVSGLLVAPKDVAALGEALLTIGRDGVLLQKLSQGAVNRVREAFERQKQARELEGFYREAILLHQSRSK